MAEENGSSRRDLESKDLELGYHVQRRTSWIAGGLLALCLVLGTILAIYDKEIFAGVILSVPVLSVIGQFVLNQGIKLSHRPIPTKENADKDL